jgi:hypothetical protein
MISLIGLILLILANSASSVTCAGGAKSRRGPDRASSVPNVQPRPTAVPLIIETACRVEVSPSKTWEMLGRLCAAVCSSVCSRVWRRWGCDDEGSVDKRDRSLASALDELEVGPVETIGMSAARSLAKSAHQIVHVERHYLHSPARPRSTFKPAFACCSPSSNRLDDPFSFCIPFNQPGIRSS